MKMSEKFVKIENKVNELKKRIKEEGNTDTIEDELDEIEIQIKNLKMAGISKVIINKLKNKVDEIK